MVLEREFWIAVMEAQRELGIDTPEEAIAAYKRVKDQVNLESIAKREAITRHDVKARIEEFCDLAGFEHVHKGMTSRDLTENVEQLQVASSLKLVRERAVAALLRMGKRAHEYRALPIAGRTHNVAPCRAARNPLPTSGTIADSGASRRFSSGRSACSGVIVVRCRVNIDGG